jgi:hypothetical protein
VFFLTFVPTFINKTPPNCQKPGNWFFKTDGI